jgi:alkyl sulfatase BDS1-like metallo-beta-lactamase superfamily hydrolase
LDVSNDVLSRRVLEQRAEQSWQSPHVSSRVRPYELTDDILFVTAFGNGIVFRTSDGLVLVDGGGPQWAPDVHAAVRRWSDLPVHTVIYTHGHADHVSGVSPFDAEAAAAGRAAPTVVAHEAVAGRLDTYVRTADYRRIVNGRQFRSDAIRSAASFHYPDLTYSNRLDLEVGNLRLELHHASGETNDHTWVWLPDHRILCCGDLFIGAAPNAGNPQKALRNPATWAVALREMASVEAETMLPGHGFPVFGAGRVRQVLEDTAEYLESLVEQVLAIMNRGGRMDEVLRTVRPPAHLEQRPFLQATYDDPEFILHNAWRVFGGWWDGNPATLRPAGEIELAHELAQLAGGAGRLADRALALAREGRLRAAAHLAELAALAAGEDPAVHEIRADVFEQRAGEESSLMARNIFLAAAEESREHTRTQS